MLLHQAVISCRPACCAVCARSVLSTLCDPGDCSPPGSSVRGVLQMRIWEWVPLPSPTMGICNFLGCFDSGSF